MKPYFLTLYIFLILTNISFATEKPVSSDNFYISFLNKNKEIEQYSNQELQQNFDVTEMTALFHKNCPCWFFMHKGK